MHHIHSSPPANNPEQTGDSEQEWIVNGIGRVNEDQLYHIQGVQQYCKPTFIPVKETARSTTAILSRIFIAADQYLPYSCNFKKKVVDKAWSQKLILLSVFNQKL